MERGWCAAWLAAHADDHGERRNTKRGKSPTFTPSPNFDYLGHHDLRLVQAATMAERVLGTDPVGSLRHLRLFAELMVQNIAAPWGVYGEGYAIAELTREVSRKGLPVDVNRMFRTLRDAGNRASLDSPSSGCVARWIADTGVRL